MADAYPPRIDYILWWLYLLLTGQGVQNGDTLAGLGSVANLRPNGNGATLSVSSSPVALPALPAGTTHVLWTLTTATANVTFGGEAPTTGTGHPLAVGASGVWSAAMAQGAQLIRSTGSDAAFYFTPMRL